MSNTKNKKTNLSEKKAGRFIIYVYIELIASIVFTLLSLGFHGDISLLAFPVSLIMTGVTVYFGYFKMIKPKDGSSYFIFLKLIQYIPFVFLISFILRRAGNFGTAYWFDLLSVLAWCVVFVFSLIISNCLNDKHFKISMSTWEVVPENRKKFFGIGRVLFELVDWIDALVQAVFMVLLIQIFVLQLYVIPSESMVPQYLIGDRVAVSKLNCGPKFPLTDIGLGDFTKYKRGDIVVLRNPHYSMDRKSEVKTVVSQLIYMLTFTGVNLNTDDNGELKADPLVKRIVGVEGEQLVMQDGILYSRTKDSPEFKPITENVYPAWNLNELNPAFKRGIARIPFDQSFYDSMLGIEKLRRELDLNDLADDAMAISQEFTALCYDSNFIEANTAPDLTISFASRDFIKRQMEQTALQLMNAENGSAWFNKFMTDWIEKKDVERDIYAEANFRLNLMAKMTYGKVVLEYAKKNRGDVYVQAEIDELINMYYVLSAYISELDFRNMPVFPANDENGNPAYLPEGCYFMMGDNRFNSLDLRHKSELSIEPLTKDDRYSFKYESLISPLYVNKKYILGKPMFRFYRKAIR